MPRTWVLKLTAVVMLALEPEAVFAAANAVVGATTAPKATVEHTVKHAIYATGWDGTVRIQADLDGTLTVL